LAEFTHERQVQIARQRLAAERASRPNPKNPFSSYSHDAKGFANPWGCVGYNMSRERGRGNIFGYPEDST
jgi:hypothetical protein